MNPLLKFIVIAIISAFLLTFVGADCFSEQGYPGSTMGGGSLTVLSCPSGAQMYLDQVLEGITPVYLQSVSNGTHPIMLIKEGYKNWQGTVNVKDTEPALVKATLEPFSKVVNIVSNPTGADVYIDDIYTGVTPITLTNVFPGSHYLTLKKAGYWNYNTYFSTNNADNTVYVTMIPSLFTPHPTSIPVTIIPTINPTTNPTISDFGAITIQSAPPGASVSLDGQYSGITPVTLSSVHIGNHNLELRLSGYNTWQTGVSVSPRTETSLSVTLTKGGSSKPNGYYAVHSNVNGAKIYFDDKLKGIIKNNGFSLKTTSAQYQSYGVEMNGYEPYYGDISKTPVNGGIVHLDAMLIKSNYQGRATGWYVIRTILNGAKVYFDGKYMGSTKNYGLVVQVYPATTQYSSYKVTYPGYKTVEGLFTEAPDSFGTVDVDVTLSKN